MVGCVVYNPFFLGGGTGKQVDPETHGQVLPRPEIAKNLLAFSEYSNPLSEHNKLVRSTVFLLRIQYSL